jgi:hypothetical protein
MLVCPNDCHWCDLPDCGSAGCKLTGEVPLVSCTECGMLIPASVRMQVCIECISLFDASRKDER